MTSPDTPRAYFEAGDWARARESAVAALAASPDDVELLRIAGRAGVETGDGEAVERLRRVTELHPGDAADWRHLGDALATEGRTEEATEAFRRAVEIDPADEVALTALGHTAFQGGNREDGVSYLERAAERAPGASTAAISLVEMYRTLGELDAALAVAVKIADSEQGDTLAALDVAELSLDLGRFDEATQAFARVRALDDLPEHEVYALHGMIQAALAREDWPRALELAREASALDPYGRTASVLGFLEAQDGGEGSTPAPTREEVDAALRESLSEHRRAHAEDRQGPPEGSA